MKTVAMAYRGLSRTEAARYVGISPTKFDELVGRKRLPRPRSIDGDLIWDLRELEPERRRPTMPPHLDVAGIYVAGFGVYVKIGWSSCVGRRLNELQVTLPESLVVHKTIPGDTKKERTLHKRFVDLRLNGEWFRHDGELAAWIAAGCPDD